MSATLQVLCTLPAGPDLATSPYGPFVVHPCEGLGAVAQRLHEQACDALLLGLGPKDTLSALLQWPDLARLVLDNAIVLVAPEPTLADLQALLQAGVQDVVPLREATPHRLSAALRQAVERKRLEMAARRAHATDLDTGLPNHSQLMEHMSHLLALREREPAAMALLALRVEGLATAEAQFGAESANVLRRKVAVRLRSGLRASDVVASLGADTFAVLLAWMDQPDDGDRVGAKLVQLLKRPFKVAGQDVGVMVSVGIGQYPAHGKDAKSLLNRALAQATGMSSLGRSGASGGLGDARLAGAANDED
ncbi:diguanylate cyclase (GGDEF) domain-containing protein [Burkholderiales bacterium JOSHI_001]|nr:diguanylate cyclase (GGDEF) domain-containing protein [Burkholderiales bacterium JOSHI_001]